MDTVQAKLSRKILNPFFGHLARVSAQGNPTPLRNSTRRVRILCDLDASGKGHCANNRKAKNFDGVFQALAVVGFRRDFFCRTARNEI